MNHGLLVGAAQDVADGGLDHAEVVAVALLQNVALSRVKTVEPGRVRGRYTAGRHGRWP